MTQRNMICFLVCISMLAEVAKISAVVGSPTTTVAPNAFSGVEGSGNNGFPFWPVGANPPSMRYQQVYASSVFSALSPGGELITHVAFRADAQAPAFFFIVPSVQINLSTTAAAPDGMSATFADNVGADDTIVFGPAPLTLSSALGPAAGPKPFNIVIALETPFFYNPGAGNLLLDVRSMGGSQDISLDAQDTLGDAIGRQYSNITSGNLNSPTASTLVPSLGLITRFTTIAIPEPATLLLIGAGMLAMFFRGRTAVS